MQLFSLFTSEILVHAIENLYALGNKMLLNIQLNLKLYYMMLKGLVLWFIFSTTIKIIHTFLIFPENRTPDSKIMMFTGDEHALKFMILILRPMFGIWCLHFSLLFASLVVWRAVTC